MPSPSRGTISGFQKGGFFYQSHAVAFDATARTNAKKTLNAAKEHIKTFREQLDYLCSSRFDHVDALLDQLFPTPPDNAPE